MTSTQSISDQANRKNLRLLITLRGIAFCAQIAAIVITVQGLHIVLPFGIMIAVASVLAIFNLYSFLRVEAAKPVTHGDLFLALSVDVLVLTLQLHFSGGTSNPFISFYMLPVIIGAVTLDKVRAWLLYGLTMVAYLALALMVGPTPRATVVHSAHAHRGPLIDHTDLHMNGMMIGYFLCAGVLVFAVTHIRTILSARDAELTQLKTRTLEQDHILRLGLLAGGAAHELGTPLTTLSVILRDWLTLSPPRRKAEREADLVTMSSQVERCKAIISDMVAASGQTRGEGAGILPLRDFLKGITDRWRDTQPADLSVDLTDNATLIVADRVLEQTLFNVLDNALEASKSNGETYVGLCAAVTSGVLTLDVSDRGPGFAPEVLRSPGQPFQSTRAVSGRGLGLFLVRNTIQSLGGTLEITSSPAGSRLRLTVPLSSLQVSADA